MKHAVKHIHFVGIGGSGMSGIAEVLLTLGYRVSGSDGINGDDEAAGPIECHGSSQGHRAQNINGADAVVVSTAVAEDNPELLEARAKRDPDRAARRDAGGVDAAEAGDRDCGHARQDDYDQSGRQRARGRRLRSHVRDWRSPQFCWARMRGWAVGTTSWSKPTSPTRRFSI